MIPVFSQEKNTNVIFNTDFLTRHVWRGRVLSENPNIQPALLVTTPKFDFGALGSADVTFNPDGPNWNEFDLFVEYRPIPVLGVRLTDFYFQNISVVTPDTTFIDPNSTKYFDYGKNTTGHYLNLDVLFYVGAKVDSYDDPYNTLTFNYSVVLYGNDENGFYDTEIAPDSSAFLENAFSSYFDFTDNYKNKLKVFVGMATGRGFYNTLSDNGKLVNVGLRYDAKIPITEKFSLPVYGSLVTNPNTEQVYFLVGISLFSIE